METSTSTSLLCEEGGSEPSHPPLSQQELCASFMEAGNLLFSAHPELFSNALEQLSNQLSLAVAKAPGLLRSRAPFYDEEQHPVSIDENCSSPEDEVVLSDKQQKSKKKGKHRTFRKYVLPKDAPPEYYQCMDCGEQRPENSFLGDHMHLGKTPRVRWFCPLCEAFFSVTHRSGHIKCKHSNLESFSSSSSSCVSCTSPHVEETVPKESGRKSGIVINAQSATVVMSSSSSCDKKPEEEVERRSENTQFVMTSSCEEKEEEEKYEVPEKKRQCVSSCESVDNSSTLSPLYTSSPVDDFLNNPSSAINLPFCSTSSTTSTSELAEEEEEKDMSFINDQQTCYDGNFTDDLFPAFRCPSYVLKPYGFDDSKTPSNGFLF